ncbi:uncharacterized protein LOC116930081 [Daphnia magna]|uniref:uncharacterized protein LOC116930081 n=1 Tax=Daphnia magna TaxID=35525 RepID=UPI001E1BDCBE|nr:uncharacterized protein LOC116930081 [Daphnia magna]XP_032793334.2 uncharacterized protein LOC116930081 [Daphnia magna]XP_045024185.1 uncharacterized protein LOC116930081 [Daphnia magna]XP_045024186.1 uncharacterized protein LOC116930081 [Daphnia magna]XP_045024187.1 uncharacterized protein LOC116930081 [Daphnia magna]
MDCSRISVSALGRDVLVGDLYNYYTDNILKSSILVPGECIRIEHKLIPETERYFFFNQPDKFKPSLLGINSHLKESIEQGSVDLNLLWFADFLRVIPSEGDENEALVTVFFRVIRRTETLDQHFFHSKIFDYQLDCGGWATHLVEQVVYGAELICSMRRPVDWRRETKDSAEENIYLVAKAYFDRIIGPKAINTEPPIELEKVSCRILSSLEDVQPTESSFRMSCEFLKDVINFKEDNQPAKLWRPIYIVRRQIPKQIEARILLDRLTDKRLKIERKWHWIMKETHRLAKHPFLNRVPPFERAIRQFIELLEPAESEIMQYDINVIAKKCIQDQVSKDIKTMADCLLLSDMVDWLIQRRSEIDAICLMLKGNHQMGMFDMPEIESRPSSSGEKRARVFVLKVDYISDPLMERIQNLIGNLEPVHKLPVFPVISSGKERLGIISRAFHGFSEEARWCSNEQYSYYQIGLVPVSSPLEDGTIKTIVYPAIEMTPSCLPAAQSSPKESEKDLHEDHHQLLCLPINNHQQHPNSPKKTLTVSNQSDNPYEKVAYFLLKSIMMISPENFDDENNV